MAMQTRWKPAEPVPLPEYPRPLLVRQEWINLNGWWDYAIQGRGEGAPSTYDSLIRVPYPVESQLSGVQKALLPDQRLWYRRTFQIPPGWLGRRVLLHFGAVDYQCEAWVNGELIGDHRGGFLPFSFEISARLQPGENELLVAVWDPTDSGLQQRGKQVLQPKGIWYTAVSGIWGTVWLEPVGESSLARLRLTPDLQAGTLTIENSLRGPIEDVELEATALDRGARIATARGPAETALQMDIPNPRLWCPDDPHLYDLELRLIQNGRVIDQAASYFAMRKYSLVRDGAGHLRFALNDKPLFLYGPLDQGYFPDGLYTPPSEEALLSDIEYARKIGCNLIRKHVKIESPRWYAHCDRLGMIVWQDMPNGGLPDGEWIAALALLFGFRRKDTRRLERFGRANVDDRAEYRFELEAMIDHLYNHPCIAVWVPFNESWGQFRAEETTEWVKLSDPTRLVDHASGWFDQGGGDFQSRHVYFKRLRRPRPDPKRAFVLSEFGGYSLALSGHLWNPEKKFGYRFLNSSAELTQAYLDLLEKQLKPLIPLGLSAAIYTQTSDVEIEINGYLSYDREVEKMDAETLRKAHTLLRL